jgi:hypothetical protein
MIKCAWPGCTAEIEKSDANSGWIGSIIVPGKRGQEVGICPEHAAEQSRMVNAGEIAPLTEYEIDKWNVDHGEAWRIKRPPGKPH